jgi:translation initiation factor IF-3
LNKRFKRTQDTRKFYRTNDRIFAHTLRVIDAEGKQVGVITKVEALAKAAELGMDLVEVAPQAQPPVAKIIDFNKFLYQEAKRKQEEKKKAKVSETKEIRLSPFISDNDLQVMVRRGRDFLEDGDKVRLALKFRGRQITHPEFGRNVMNKFVESVSDISKVDREPHFEGNQLVALLSAERKKAQPKAENKDYAEDKNEKISSEKV